MLSRYHCDQTDTAWPSPLERAWDISRRLEEKGVGGWGGVAESCPVNLGVPPTETLCHVSGWVSLVHI